MKKLFKLLITLIGIFYNICGCSSRKSEEHLDFSSKDNGQTAFIDSYPSDQKNNLNDYVFKDSLESLHPKSGIEKIQSYFESVAGKDWESLVPSCGNFSWQNQPRLQGQYILSFFFCQIRWKKFPYLSPWIL
jgi:hypothetical protein